MTSPEGKAVWFTDLYDRTFQPVYAYVRRRVASEADAPDLVADVFAVAWAKRSAVPAAPEDRLWLFAVARRRLWEHHRGADRQTRLVQRIADEPATAPDSAGTSSENASEALLDALDRLRPVDREVVRLIAWERLTHADVAVVLGCSPNAVSIRWHRTIRRLRRDLCLGEPSGRTGVGDVVALPSMEGDQ